MGWYDCDRRGEWLARIITDNRGADNVDGWSCCCTEVQFESHGSRGKWDLAFEHHHV